MTAQVGVCAGCLEPITRGDGDAWWTDWLGWASCPQLGTGTPAAPHRPIPSSVRDEDR